eukprot:7390994-Prymnesium_polylepis.1
MANLSRTPVHHEIGSLLGIQLCLETKHWPLFNRRAAAVVYHFSRTPVHGVGCQGRISKDVGHPQLLPPELVLPDSVGVADPTHFDTNALAQG